MAFEYFASVGVEIAVLEVGMGGRLDATNVVDPAISVIADISLDHQKYLGDTIAEIAREKAGHHSARTECGDAAATSPGQRRHRPRRSWKRRHAASARPSTFLRFRRVQLTISLVESPPRGRNRYPLTVMGEEIMVDSPLPGRHQFETLRWRLPLQKSSRSSASK